MGDGMDERGGGGKGDGWICMCMVGYVSVVWPPLGA